MRNIASTEKKKFTPKSSKTDNPNSVTQPSTTDTSILPGAYSIPRRADHIPSVRLVDDDNEFDDIQLPTAVAVHEEIFCALPEVEYPIIVDAELSQKRWKSRAMAITTSLVLLFAVSVTFLYISAIMSNNNHTENDSSGGEELEGISSLIPSAGPISHPHHYGFQKEYLLQVYELSGGNDSWLENLNWGNEDISFCEGWFGVVCNMGKVVELDLHANGLTGNMTELGVSLSMLESMRRLDLSGNDLTGYVPDELCTLKEKDLEILIVGKDVACSCCESNNPTPSPSHTSPVSESSSLDEDLDEDSDEDS